MPLNAQHIEGWGKLAITAYKTEIQHKTGQLKVGCWEKYKMRFLLSSSIQFW